MRTWLIPIFLILLVVSLPGCGGGEGLGIKNNPDRPKASDKKEDKW